MSKDEGADGHLLTARCPISDTLFGRSPSGLRNRL